MSTAQAPLGHLANCHWSCSLDVDCPECGDTFDYLQTDHHDNGGFEQLAPVAKRCQVRGVPCPNCGASLTLIVQDGL